MRATFPDPRLEFFLGDVRDRARVAARVRSRARPGHPRRGAEAGPGLRARSLRSAEDERPRRRERHRRRDRLRDPKVVALSTDKAASPLNAYGKSKAMAESLFVRGNAYAGRRRTRFSSCATATSSAAAAASSRSSSNITAPAADPDHRSAHDAVLDAAVGRRRPGARGRGDDAGRRDLRPGDSERVGRRRRARIAPGCARSRPACALARSCTRRSSPKTRRRRPCGARARTAAAVRHPAGDAVLALYLKRRARRRRTSRSAATARRRCRRRCRASCRGSRERPGCSVATTAGRAIFGARCL
jgi:hypothetical protein